MDIFFGVVALMVMAAPFLVLARRRPAPGEHWFPAGSAWSASEPEQREARH